MQLTEGTMAGITVIDASGVTRVAPALARTRPGRLLAVICGVGVLGAFVPAAASATPVTEFPEVIEAATTESPATLTPTAQAVIEDGTALVSDAAAADAAEETRGVSRLKGTLTRGKFLPTPTRAVGAVGLAAQPATAPGYRSSSRATMPRNQQRTTKPRSSGTRPGSFSITEKRPASQRAVRGTRDGPILGLGARRLRLWASSAMSSRSGAPCIDSAELPARHQVGPILQRQPTRPCNHVPRLQYPRRGTHDHGTIANLNISQRAR
ncbi:MAG: hypothetical protein ACRDLS_15245 [Solirubrobacteraceae bacterium]